MNNTNYPHDFLTVSHSLTEKCITAVTKRVSVLWRLSGGQHNDSKVIRWDRIALSPFSLCTDSLGFCELHVHCPVNSCLSRNQARSQPLPDEVVLEMAKRMEPPNPVRNGWEQRSFTLTSDGAFSPQDVYV